MKKLKIVRIDGHYVFCEDSEKKLFAIERDEISDDIANGSSIIISDEGELVVECLKKKNEKNKK